MCQRLVPIILQELPGSWSPDHPLHIGLPREDFLEFHLECCGRTKTVEEEFIGALLKEADSPLYRSQANIYVTVHVLSDLTSDVETSDFLSLYVTPCFLTHYGFEYNEILCFRNVVCFPIEKVIFGAKNSKSFEWSKTSKWHKQLLLSSCSTKSLCRIGDVLLIPPAKLMLDSASLLFDFVTLECLPFAQGVLTTSTTVIVIDDSENSDNFENDFKQYKNDRGNVCVYSDMISYLHLMNYTSSLLLPGAVHGACFNVNPLVKSITTSHSLLKVLRNRFQVQIIPKLSADLREALLNLPDTSDPLNTIFLTKSALERLGIGSYVWVKVKLVPPWVNKVRRCSSTPLPGGVISSEYVRNKKHRHYSGYSDGAKEMTNCRMATVCCLPYGSSSSYHADDDTSYVSPHLWFNLNRHPSNLLQPTSQLMVETIPFGKESSPPYASEVYIALVQSPDYNGNISCSGILHKHFETPRYVCKGDILSISSKDDLTLHQKMDDPFSTNWPVIYFRVSMIEGPESSDGYLADKLHTRLYQSGTTQNFIPVTMSAYYGHNAAHPLWNSPMPSGMAQYVDMVQELVAPFLKLKNKMLQVNSNILVSGPLGCGKTVVVKAVAKCLNLHLYQVNCYEFLGESPAVVEVKLKSVIEKASVYVPCIMLLKNIDYIGKEKELKGEDPRVLNSLNELLKNINSSGSVDWPVVTIATTSEMQLLNSDISSTFLHHVNIEPPTEQERSMIISDLLSSCVVGNEVSIPYLAQRTAGFVLGDLSLLVRDGARISFSRVRKKLSDQGSSCAEETDVLLSGVPIIQEDLLSSLEKLQSSVAESIGAPEVPNVRWEDIGGLSDVKQEILDTIQLPLEHPEIVTSGLQRSGVLLYGPPGTGKTLLAKAVATECSLNFLSVKGPELINMYVGQSEENIREVFSRARGASPCVIFFDELDSLAPNRGRSGDSGGVMDRVVSQLLAELDGLNKAADVFVIGATNRPDLIDPALLRPGRFDRHLFVGIPEDKMSRIKILKALTRKFCLAEDVDFEVVEESCPPNLSGADFYSLCSDAMMNKIQKNIELIESGQLQDDNAELVVDIEDFREALKSLVPSVTTEELAKYSQTKLGLLT